MLTTLSIIAVLLAVKVILNGRKLARMEALLHDVIEHQDAVDDRLNHLSRKTKKTTCKQRAFDRKIQQQRRKQDQFQHQQEKIQREQRKQADQIEKLRFTVTQADAVIIATRERLTGFYSLLDIALATQAAAYPASAEDVRAQRQILTLTNQIHTAERKLAKAEFERDAANQKLQAA